VCLCVTVKIGGPSFLEAPARSLTSLPAVDGPVPRPPNFLALAVVLAVAVAAGWQQLTGSDVRRRRDRQAAQAGRSALASNPHLHRITGQRSPSIPAPSGKGGGWGTSTASRRQAESPKAATAVHLIWPSPFSNNRHN
jgi:hypothetical protein